MVTDGTAQTSLLDHSAEMESSSSSSGIGESSTVNMVADENDIKDKPKRLINLECDMRQTVKRRIPLVDWLPSYRISLFFQDLLAGFTVSLTEIPQGIAFAVVAGLPPVYGLYSGFMGGLVYFFFGSCKDINIGPTTIMALMIQPHISRLGNNMAVLMTFISGCIIFLLGVLHLGFVVEFFSYPIIAGFTTAAALSIATSQLNSLFGLSKKGDTFLKKWELVFENLGQTRKWDAILGFFGIAVLVLMKEMSRYGSLKNRPDWSKRRNIWGKCIFFLSLARNALVVIFGTVLAYYLSKEGDCPFKLTKTVDGGIPPFEPPPFSSTKNDSNGTIEHFNFEDMINDFGSTIAFTPLIALLEHVAISKAFSKGKALDTTQEMLALGLCNIFGSFFRSMPVTGSFTRTAVNNASGVRTTFGGLFTGVFVLLALQFLTGAFYYIPKATLASVVIAAMCYLCDFKAFYVLWKTKRLDLIPLTVTLVTCLLLSLEYGILIGIAVNLISVLYASARPKILIEKEKLPTGDVFVVTPKISLLFPAAEYTRETILAECIDVGNSTVVVNGKYIGNIDATVAKSFSVLADEMKLRKQKLIYWNFKPSIQTIITGNNRVLSAYFRQGSLEDIIDDPLLERNGNVEDLQINVIS